MTVVIGLTGSIGTGKSTIANMFLKLGIPVVDADQVAREVVEVGESTLEKIHATFGDSILATDGSLNRKALGAIVFQDEQKRLELNAIIHPAIRKRMREKQDAFIKANEPCIVVDIPLLFENNLMDTVDKIIVVYVNEAEQLRRIMHRDNMSLDDAKKRMRSQLSIEEKKNLADAIIDNTGTMESSFKQLQSLLTKWNLL